MAVSVRDSLGGLYQGGVCRTLGLSRLMNPTVRSLEWERGHWDLLSGASVGGVIGWVRHHTLWCLSVPIDWLNVHQTYTNDTYEQRWTSTFSVGIENYNMIIYWCQTDSYHMSLNIYVNIIYKKTMIYFFNTTEAVPLMF